MRKCIRGLSYFCFLLAIPLTAAATTRVYVMSRTSTVEVIDTDTNKVVTTIDGVGVPHGAVFSADGSKAYITSEDKHAIFEVDTRNQKILRQAPLTGKANLPAMTKDGKLIFVCMRPPANSVDVVDVASMQMIKSIKMRDGMHDCYTSPDGKYVAASSPTGKFAAVIDVASKEIAWELPFDRKVQTMSVEAGPTGATSRLFIDLERLNGFVVVDFATHKEVGRVQLTDKTSGFLYDNDEPGHSVPTHSSYVSPDGKSLWIASRGTNQVYQYSLPALKQIGHVMMPWASKPGEDLVGGDPHWLAITPDGKKIYVCNSALNTVSAIDVKTMKVVASIPVGKVPGHIFAVDIQ